MLRKEAHNIAQAKRKEEEKLARERREEKWKREHAYEDLMNDDTVQKSNNQDGWDEDDFM